MNRRARVVSGICMALVGWATINGCNSPSEVAATKTDPPATKEQIDQRIAQIKATTMPEPLKASALKKLEEERANAK